MIYALVSIAQYFALFYGVDYVLQTFTRLQGIYYLLHFCHNMAIMYLTAPNVWTTLTEFDAISTAPKDVTALQLVFALHFYHIAAYKSKFRRDDWLHHGLMIGIALPIGALFESGSLLGYSLFFTTGLPGGIDYLLLFLVRNGWIDRTVEKRVNTWLNVWIRSPGCVSHAAFVLAHLSATNTPFGLYYMFAFVTAFLNYWNGQYFMAQVVDNNARVMLTNPV